MSATGISLMHAGPNQTGSQARIDHGARWGQVQPDPTGRSATGKRRDKIGSNFFATSQRSAADCLAHHLYSAAWRDVCAGAAQAYL
eukprot:COSAG01_NODE_227_length_21107_cov_85.615099_7_plen_86_part_00